MAENHVFGKRSLDNIATVKPDLQKLCHLALKKSEIDFVVTEGIRTLERQKMLVATGKSKTLRSYHLVGDAIDFYPYYDGKVQVQASLSKFKIIADAFKAAATELGMRITWGGDWKWIDGPHIQVERK